MKRQIKGSEEGFCSGVFHWRGEGELFGDALSRQQTEGERGREIGETASNKTHVTYTHPGMDKWGQQARKRTNAYIQNTPFRFNTSLHANHGALRVPNARDLTVGWRRDARDTIFGSFGPSKVIRTITLTKSIGIGRGEEGAKGRQKHNSLVKSASQVYKKIPTAFPITKITRIPLQL